MADITKTAQVKVDFVDNTKSGIASFSSGLENINKSSGMLTDGLKSLGLIVGGLFAGKQILNFFEGITKRAMDDEIATTRLNGAFQAIGSTLTNLSPQISEFEDYMQSLGQHVSDTQDSLTKLIRVTGDVNMALKLSKLASDLTASGILDLQSNTDALANLMNGRARMAAAAYGFAVKDAITPTEALALIQTKLNTTLEQYANTSAGKITKIKTQWDEFKGFLGTALLPILGGVMDSISGITGGLETSATTAQLWGYELMRNAAKAGAFIESLNPLSKEHFGLDNFKKTLALINAGIDEEEKKITDNLVRSTTSSIKALTNKVGEVTDITAKDLEASFRDVAKAVVSAVSDQEKAIDKLIEMNAAEKLQAEEKLQAAQAALLADDRYFNLMNPAEKLKAEERLRKVSVRR